MRVGELWRIDFLDHFDGSTSTAWTEATEFDITPPLCRACGFVVKKDRRAVALAVSYGEGMTSNPFTIVRKAIVAKERIKLPPLIRKPG